VAPIDINEGGHVAIAQYKWPMRVTKLSVKSMVITSRTAGFEHTNFYFATMWNGEWAPATGYGCIFLGSRIFSMQADSDAGNSNSTFANNRNEPFQHTMTLSPTELRWVTKSADPLDERPESTFVSIVKSFYTGSQRYLLLGGYESENRFDNIVIEGYFGVY
jgi:hypothetical protein